MQPRPLLGHPPLVNVLEDGDQALRCAVLVDQRRHGDVHPDRRPVGAAAAKVPGQLGAASVGDLRQREVEALRVLWMREVVAAEARHRLGCAADDGGHALVDANQTSVERDVRNAHGGLPEHGLELLALA